MASLRAGNLITVLQFIAGTGANSAQVRSAAGIRPGDLMDPDQLLDINCLALALESAADQLDEPAFTLRSFSVFDLEALGLISYAVLNASTVSTGVRNLTRYAGTLIHGSTIDVVQENDTVTLQIAVPDLIPSSARQILEGAALLVLRMLRRLIDDESWHPLAVSFTHGRPGSLSPYRSFFGVSPQFGAPGNELRFDASVMPRRVLAADRSVLPFVEQQLQEVLGRGPDEPSWLRTLKYQIATRLCDGHPSLAEVAPDLRMSPRTLQRRLESRGEVYRDLVQQTRKRLAMQYLLHSEMELNEIAFLLGYSEFSAFSHAFRRWTGTSPGRARGGST